MTRINADLDPATLHRRHLVAELREITMVPASLRRSLRTKGVKDVLNSIPYNYTLGTGHIKFFYDKQEFLRRRFVRLAEEMERRGYIPDRERIRAFNGFEDVWNNNWQANAEDNALVQDRINQRIQQKPYLYIT